MRRDVITQMQGRARQAGSKTISWSSELCCLRCCCYAKFPSLLLGSGVALLVAFGHPLAAGGIRTRSDVLPGEGRVSWRENELRVGGSTASLARRAETEKPENKNTNSPQGVFCLVGVVRVCVTKYNFLFMSFIHIYICSPARQTPGQLS